ncbi:arsenical pump membrane protein [Silvimonas terrae]|uniref:Arsenical pump membrane protein n=1 Tax=Silvimonas terrae TaxID=300266 RepID=A0A840RF23_9NEIS|nr:arsenic transporter [Silvimonas terrae]MBB5191617.1 arsenical pump membrane protein [Silvimonas terrae]
MPAHQLAWALAACTTAAVILRPLRWTEAVWACIGAALAVLLGLLPLADAWHAIGKGLDVYLFLGGMMLLSEVARREGLFEWLAGIAVNHANGSPARLFGLVYLVGTGVTVLLSNDATAVVLTPAVFAVARRAEAPALPLLLICALIANAASFVLPVSNPANLVVFGSHMPPLAEWARRFWLPSAAAIAVTWLMLRFTQRKALIGQCAPAVPVAPLSGHGKVALAGIGVTATALLLVSALGLALGLPTLILGVLTAAIVTISQRVSPLPLLRGVAWSVLPLVAGLFVMVDMLARAGLMADVGRGLHGLMQHSEPVAAATAGVAIAALSNVINNLPAGLIGASVMAAQHLPDRVADSLLIGVDLGPNLSVTGSLATILWLGVLRREGLEVGFWAFLKTGALVMPPALAAAIVVRILLGA